jgi:hypothetical protein
MISTVFHGFHPPQYSHTTFSGPRGPLPSARHYRVSELLPTKLARMTLIPSPSHQFILFRKIFDCLGVCDTTWNDGRDVLAERPHR